MALVSVIIPVHDAGRFLDSCLRSVRAQTHHDLQVICVDDGSNDGSAAVLEQHAQADRRVQKISQSNAGPGSARNAGLTHALGDFIMFVDADDLVPTEAVETHLNALRHSRSDFSTGRVTRLSGTYSWPSTLHENGLARPATGTHIFKEPGLLFDTTSWNKLFRRDHWTAHRYTFPERVVFEDVALMIEAHCRASSVEVLADVVYHWRRRDDGTASITMRRDDPHVLRDRVESLRKVRELLREIAPTSVQKAAESKFLRYDLGSYFRELEDIPRDVQTAFMCLVQKFVEDSPGDVVHRLPAHLRVAYRLVALDRLPELLAYLAFLRENGGHLPIHRRGLALRVDLGPARTIVPRRYSSARRRMPLRMGVDGVSWHDDALVIEGFGFIDGVAMSHPAAALRRLQLVDPSTREQRTAWVAPRRLPTPSSHDRSARTYDWAAFRIAIPITLLDPGAMRSAARWQVNLQVLALGAGGGSALGPPSGPSFTEVGRGSTGLVIRVGWTASRKMVIEAVRAVVAVTGVDHLDGLLHLSFRQVQPLGAPRLITARLTSANGVVVEVPLGSSPGGAEETLWALVDPVRLQEQKGLRLSLSFGLTVVTEDGVGAVTNDLAHECTFPLGRDTVVVADDGRGGVELVITGSRTAVTGASWCGDTLRVQGVCSPHDALPRLAWCHGSGGMVEGVPRRTRTGFDATFEPFEVPGPDGVHPLAAGEWILMHRQVDGSWQPVITSYGPLPVGQASPSGARPESIRIGRNSRRDLVMWVAALSASERGGLAQERLQRGAYQRSRREPVRNTVLLQSWGGKKFSDNPRALTESLPAAFQDATVVVVVKDRSIAVPGRFDTVIAGSRAHYDQLARARLVISNDAMPTHYRKRPGQRYLQTWHGTPLKRIGLDIERIRFRNKNYLRDLVSESSKWDWLVTQNAYSAEIFRRAFAYDGPILETGYPRNDLLADPERCAARRDATRRWLDIRPDQTAVLWAPTWRDDVYAADGGYGSSLLVDRRELEALLPPDTVLLLHGHHLTGFSQTHLGHDRSLRDVSSHPDLRDLIVASDALVTDYSSLMFDYALTGLPMIFFVPDLEHYRQIRGLYLDLPSVAPGPLLSTADELADALRALCAIRVEHDTARRDFGRCFGGLEDGGAGTRVWSAMSEVAHALAT